MRIKDEKQNPLHLFISLIGVFAIGKNYSSHVRLRQVHSMVRENLAEWKIWTIRRLLKTFPRGVVQELL